MRHWFSPLWRSRRVVPGFVDPQERQWVAQAVVIGLVVWVFVFALKEATHASFAALARAVVQGPSIALMLVPLLAGAVGVGLIVRFAHEVVYYRDEQGRTQKLNAVEGDGLERAIALYFSSEAAGAMGDKASPDGSQIQPRWQLPTFRLAFRKLAASFLTLASGGAGGLEAGVALVGESLASGLSHPGRSPEQPSRRRWFHAAVRWMRARDTATLQTAQLCGVSAAIATLLGTPFAAAFFAVEVMYRRLPSVDRLIYAIASALVAFFLGHMAKGGEAPFVVPRDALPPLFEPRYYLALAAVAVSVAAVASVFRWLRTSAEHAFYDGIGKLWPRLLCGALATGLVALAVDALLNAGNLAPAQETPRLVLGPGETLINEALAGKITLAVALVALVGRLLTTVSTVSSGGSAGLLYPTLCFGSLTAAAWASVSELSPTVLVAPAMTASLVSVSNIPLTAIMFVVEGFGAAFIVPALFMLVLTSTLAHQNNIYRPQRDAFDRRQIVPGLSLHRMDLPEGWAGHPPERLPLGRIPGVELVGIIERTTSDDDLQHKLLLDPDPARALKRGDILVVAGSKQDLGRFERALEQPTPDL